ncbi:pentapeptide repeat-containing protein [Kiloniella laminariae]|uniref:pentapeptide repeat-containing protein n=1 Tax=Kiloniella laminariae TaxID=454162 RepID=UPI000381FE71|nr:pentapeptide repeat-containing protein [Kiloniella laminariae]
MKDMKHKYLASAFLFLAFMLPLKSEAACVDPPQPEVNWQRCNMDGLDYDEVNLTGARLRDASFLRSSLKGADLTAISAFRVKFISTELQSAVFHSASLPEADFTKANLTAVDFTNANLKRARLFRANLRGANLTNAQLTDADLTRADLSGALWLDGKKICAEGSVGRCE